MAGIALLSAGAVSNGTPITPAFGTPPTAGNLLILTVGASGNAASTITANGAGWAEARHDLSAGQARTQIFYKLSAAGGDTAPTVSQGTVQLSEWSYVGPPAGSTVTFALDKLGGMIDFASGTANPTSAADIRSGSLIIAVEWYRSTNSLVETTTAPMNNGATSTNLANNDSTATTGHYRFSYGVTTGTGAASKDTPTFSIANNASAATIATFGFQIAYKFTASAGAEAVTGFPTTLSRQVRLVATSGAETVAGFASTLTRQLRMTAAPGAKIVTGAPITLSRQVRLIADAGAKIITGLTTTLTRQVRLTTSPGATVGTGPPTTLSRQVRMPAGAGAQIITGTPATLVAVLIRPPIAGLVIAGSVVKQLAGRATRAAAGRIPRRTP